MTRTQRLLIVVSTAVLAICLAGGAQQTAPDAPAKFDTPTLAQNPGSQSFSNGIAEPVFGDTFALDQAAFEKDHDRSTGLGPVFNARACVDCHQNPVTGGSSQFTEIRAGHKDANGNFVAATVPISGGPPIALRSIINDRALDPGEQEHVPETENIRTLRAALNTLGDGFVEAIDDSTLKDIAQHQIEVSDGRIHGEAIEVPVLEATGQMRIGRFGWKDQHSSLLSFVGDAYLNEMGVTNKLRPKDVTMVGKITVDPEDTPDSLKMTDIEHFAQFIRGTQAPPPVPILAGTPAAAGQQIFEEIGCAICHVSSIVTAPAGTAINGGAFTVPDALGNKTIHPYSDFLLHDIDTGDGIVQTPPADTANKLRTVPLWGLRTHPRHMHDLKSLTLESAIERHGGEAEHVRNRYRELSPTDKQALIAFLNSL